MTQGGAGWVPPILRKNAYRSGSEFTPEGLLREARRQKLIGEASVPSVCVLDPDGDIARHLSSGGDAAPHVGWACYHSELLEFRHEGGTYGIVPHAVGASYAVLVAEQLFASGCRLLISVTSAGQITPLRPPPYFILIDRALRDEGTSYHYVPPSEFSEADAGLLERIGALSGLGEPVERGATWTTDAPFRETREAIGAARELGILAVEMEAAALYAFAAARNRPVLCFAHVTNQMGQVPGDFEKGEHNGATVALALIAAVRLAWEQLERAGP
jgi:uridine phosphorylase